MNSTTATDRLSEVLQQYWGYDSFLPLQERAMNCVVAGRDSVVVLPTGGGKSLCYQAPAIFMGGLAVVVSPLISLMKDQVDALQSCGVPAACVNSSLSDGERREVAENVRSGRLRLLYMAPERLLSGATIGFLKESNVSFIAIDEAHCISAWGHDFRPEYRQLKIFKQTFPKIGIHAYTATATERVRKDIAAQLGLTDPQMLVGSFDRPNLIYTVERRHNRLQQICEVLERHRGNSGIVYCIRRADVDDLSAALKNLGFRALPYHAGMDGEDRKRNQEAFLEEKAETIIATVAFGMGIDKSNVRYVIHAGMPKSLEHYQQESGRAGRDGLEAECKLFYSAGDFVTWKKIIGNSEENSYQSSLKSLEDIHDYCTGMICRHRMLVNHFGQELEKDKCGACDVCLDEVDLVEDALVIGQKILSCVIRLKESFGGDHTSKVLKGSKDQRILERKHDGLSTWGILSDVDVKSIRDWIEQLVAQKFAKKVGEYNVLEVTQEGRRLLRGEVTPRLSKPKRDSKKKSSAEADSWEGVDRDLFETLRQKRLAKAQAKKLQPYMIFGDAALRDMARLRPSSLDGFLMVRGVGEKKCADYGEEFVQCIVVHCREHQLEMDTKPNRKISPPRKTVLTASAVRSFDLFKEGKTLEEVAEKLGRAVSTTRGYLTQFLQHEDIRDPAPWVDEATTERIKGAAAEVGLEKLRPIFDLLEETVPYNDIHIVVGCLRNIAADVSSTEIKTN